MNIFIFNNFLKYFIKTNRLSKNFTDLVVPHAGAAESFGRTGARDGVTKGLNLENLFGAS